LTEPRKSGIVGYLVGVKAFSGIFWGAAMAGRDLFGIDIRVQISFYPWVPTWLFSLAPGEAIDPGG
jgi:hypothetical protein